jgi:mRNA-degrading endonuclease RelE of RelBE toxin-antitoxin system
MSYKVKFIPKFEKELKRLAKKYPSFKAGFSLFLATIKNDPAQGTSLGNECYKYAWPFPVKAKVSQVGQE